MRSVNLDLDHLAMRLGFARSSGDCEKQYESKTTTLERFIANEDASDRTT